MKLIPHTTWSWAAFWTGVLAGAWAMLLLLVLGTSKAHAAEEPQRDIHQPIEGQIEMTYALVHGLVAYKWHLPKHYAEIEPPVIHIVPQDKLCEMAQLPEGCSAQGVQLLKAIYIIDTLDWTDPVQVTVLAHEYVHYLQTLRPGPDGKPEGQVTWGHCMKAIDREVEAYTIQAEILSHLPGWGKENAQRWLYHTLQMLNLSRAACRKFLHDNHLDEEQQ